jgi:hypothetical protein
MPGSRASDDIPRYGVGAGGAPTSGGGYDDTGESSPAGGMLIRAPAARTEHLLSLQNPTSRQREVDALRAASCEPAEERTSRSVAGGRLVSHDVGWLSKIPDVVSAHEVHIGRRQSGHGPSVLPSTGK